MASSMICPIFRLPNELIYAVVQQLPIVDAFQLSLTCKQFKDIVHDKSICRALLEKQAPFSPECIEFRNTWQYARAFRTLAKRRLAIAKLEPYAATILAAADSYLYVNGTLLYILNRTLRILHLRGTVQQEIVVDIRRMLDHAVEESKGTQLYKFTLLHYADNIVTCRYTHCRLTNETWLVMFNIRENWASSTRVQQPNKLFARNNAHYVVYGTYTGQGGDGHRRWVLWRYSIHQKCVVGHSKYLGAIIGSDIGENIFFTVLDDYFYAISNQSGIEFITGQHNSYYYCCRFPLADMEDLQVATKASLWRRLHDEGTIDDRWTFLRLEKSETTGAIMAVESRKEWRHGSGSSRRTYYTQELVFPADKNKNISDRVLVPGEQGAANRHWSHVGNEQEETYEDESEDEDDEEDENKNIHSLALTPRGSQATRRKQRRQPYRLPENVHPGDDSAKMIHFTCSSCFVRCYYLGSATFMDLVDIPLDADPSTRRLRLRAGSRRARALQPPCTLPEKKEKKEKSGDDPLYPLQDMNRLYHTTEVAMWPPDARREQDVTGSVGDSVGSSGQHDLRHETLDQILNPPGHTGKVSGVWDDRSLVYGVERATGTSAKGVHAIVFVTFDPSIRLPHAQPWSNESSKFNEFNESSEFNESAETTGIEAATAADWTAGFPDDDGCLQPEEIQRSWWRLSDVPMCQTIDRGFDFFHAPGSSTIAQIAG